MNNSIPYPSSRKNESLQNKPYVVIPFLALSLLIAIVLLNNLNMLYNSTAFYYNRLVSVEYVVVDNTLVLNITNNSNNTVIVREIVIGISSNEYRRTVDARIDPANTFTITYSMEELEKQYMDSQTRNPLGKIIVVTVVYEWCGRTYSQRVFIPIVDR